MYGAYIKLLQIILGQAVNKEFTTGFSLHYFTCIICFNECKYQVCDGTSKFSKYF